MRFQDFRRRIAAEQRDRDRARAALAADFRDTYWYHRMFGVASRPRDAEAPYDFQ
jgi:hypothetical protein